LEGQGDAGELLGETRKLLSGAGLECVDVAESGEAAAVVVMCAGRPMAEISTGARGRLLMVSVPVPGGSPSLQMARTAEQAAGFVPGYREARGAAGGRLDGPAGGG
jgi:hypothetical protein